MPIPDYQDLMRPVLELAADGNEHTLPSMTELLGDALNLSQEDRQAVYASGNGLIFRDRVRWARTYLKMAGLLDSPRRGYVVITNRGREVLATNPSRIDVSTLKDRFSDFAQWLKEAQASSGKKSGTETDTTSTSEVVAGASSASPDELLFSALGQRQQALAVEMLDRLLTLSPGAFERVVVELLVRMGYGGSFAEAGQAIGKSGDGGIDGVIKADRLGLDKLYVQAKRWHPGNTVGRPDVQAFAGALMGQGATRGVFITTSSFSKEALAYRPANTSLVLLNGEQLAQLMIEFNVGVSTESVIELKRIDNDYFDED